MDYQRHYDLLMDRARKRKLECYTEGHHVIPECLGGPDEKWNIVRLTPEEHYIVHQLLVKLNPGHIGLAFAADQMGSRGSNKRYGWVRRACAEAMSKKQKGVKKGPYSAQHRANISKGQLGNKRQPLTEEHKEVLRAKTAEYNRNRRKYVGPNGETKFFKLGTQPNGWVPTIRSKASSNVHRSP